ncbi:protein of unknown function [Cyanobium sp. NIES-981]|nr:protein of unknown function [Cyanobium sp. NIES-981]
MAIPMGPWLFRPDLLLMAFHRSRLPGPFGLSLWVSSHSYHAVCFSFADLVTCERAYFEALV